MSGPWDRPPSADRDQDWPSEDSNARDPWSTSEPWGTAAPDPSPGWDEWPAPPPPDDYVLEEPPPPSSDPWAESWADDAGMPAAPPPPPHGDEPRARTEPGSETPTPSTPPAAPWGDAPGPAVPPATRWGDEPEPSPPEAPSWTHEPEAATRPAAAWSEPYAAPHIEPWSPDLDPWASTDAYGVADDVVDAEVATGPSATEEPEAPAVEADHLEPEVVFPRPEADTPELTTWELPEPSSTVAAPEASLPPASAGPVGTGMEAPAWPAAEALPGATESEAAGTLPAEDATSAKRAEAAEPEEAAAEPEEAAAEPEEAATGEPQPEEAATGEPQPESPLEAPSRRSWWRSAAAPVWPPEPVEAPGEAEADAFPVADSEEGAEESEPMDSSAAEESAPMDSRPAEEAEPTDFRATAEAEPTAWEPLGGAAGATVPPVTAAGAPAGGYVAPAAPATREPDAWARVAAEPPAEEAPADRVEPEWPVAAESTQVLPPSWRAPRPDTSPPTGELRPSTAPVRTRLGMPEPEVGGEAEPEPSTAEQAVPWLIGVILLLAGMVIVLLALIFAGDASLGGAAAGPSPSDGSAVPSSSAVAGPVSSPRARPSPTSAATPMSGEPSPTPMPIPEYGPLEMVYQGRSEALAHIYLLHRDFTAEEQPEVLAQDQSLDVRQFAWAPDGTVGVALYSGLLVSVEPGSEKRALGDEIATATFGADAGTVYAARITEDGGNDVATILGIDFASGDSTELASVSYPRPEVDEEDPLPEAQFIDDGGPVRLFRMEDGTLRLWVLGGGAWDIDPAGGEASEVEDGALPTLWSPKGTRRVVTDEADGTTTLTLRDREDEVLATTTVEGLVSHLRWSPKGDMVVFTVGTSASGGGVIQNLWVWYLEDGVAPTQMTDTGAAFGAEWLGSPPLWRE